MSIGLELDEDEGRQPSEDEIKVEPVGHEEHTLLPNEYVLATHA